MLVFSHQAVSLTLPADKFEEERAQFLTLEKNLKSMPAHRLSLLDKDIHALAHYPLYPYLLRIKLQRTMTLKNKREIEAFLEYYSSQPASYGMRYRWLNYLAAKGHEHAFLDSYRAGMGAKLTCQALHYQLDETDNPKALLTDVDALWYHGKSQPDECDPLFYQWRKNGLMTPEKVIKRIEIAATEGNRRILPYLRRQLPDNLQYIADAWLAVTRDVGAVNYAKHFSLKNPNHESNVLTWAIEKLAWRNPEQAVKAYNTYIPKNVFSQPQLHIIRRAIALSYALDRRAEAGEWLQIADKPGARDDVKLWHVSYLLRQQQWQQVLAVIASAKPELQDEENYRYWRARALEALGNTMQATVLYQQLAQERHYYGFMASARIGTTPNLSNSPVPRDGSAIARLATTPATLRALEFYRLGRRTEARREWRYLLSTLPDEQVTHAGVLAYEWGLYDQAIVSFAKSGYWDDVQRRFPLAFEDHFKQQSSTYEVPNALAMAIARRESSFRADAVSPVGAAGLMQLMPGTARYVAKKKVSQDTLFNVKDNVEFGVQYLRYLMDKLDNNPVLVSASYNAGWRKVLEWLPADESLPVDIWIENIPYRETRHYVKAVMAYQHIYEQQLGSDKNIFPQLAQDVIPTTRAITTHPVTGDTQLAPQ
ncbi:transglycosylase SLT domain-containing protein [Alteromonas sp. 345S023]|uniref:Transglycosylase SLT domain-containing protein n=2 Tax=Alteromonas profundi TaxID=2696062 RepID=A0A7X5LMN2_9ALTE|nr:transglycosylase SLT domain-containing protein [Alteromonas profundi]